MTEVVQAERGLLEWRFKGQKLFTYSFATNQFKPYARELLTLRGDDVLRDAPADHLKLSGLSTDTPLCKPEISVEYLKQAIRFAAECGAPVVNTDEGPKPCSTNAAATTSAC